MLNRWTLLLVALCTSFAAVAAPLSIGISGDITSLDPHFHTLTPNANIAEHMFETLVARDENMKLKPGLALSWRALDATTWEFKLRPGVKFHDGSPFTADDVVYSLGRPALVKNSPGSYTIYTRAIREAIAVDPTTVRIKTAAPYPLMPNDVSAIYIVSKKVAEGASTEDFNTGKAMVGTGPYKFSKFDRGSRVEVVRNDAYWGPKPLWEFVTFKILTSDTARLAALLSNEIQVMENVPTSDVKRLEGDKAFAVAKTTTFRLMYLHLDSNRDKTPFVFDNAGNPMDRNPLKDVRVRRAISKAISRIALADRIMEGLAVQSGQVVPSTLFGRDPKLTPELPDAAGARKLLAEAGYPDGFQITLHATNNRYVNDNQLAPAIAGMLTRVGIKTRVEAMPSATFFSRSNKLEFSLMMVGWGSDTGEASSSLKALLATNDPAKGFGSTNRGRYSNPALDAKLTQALSTTDDAARAALIREATEIAMNDVGIVPLFFNVNVWATRANLSITPRVDERTLAMSVRPR